MSEKNMKFLIKIVFVIILLSGCSFDNEEYTNNIYLIPEGFEGSITVFYDVPNEARLKKEGKYTVIPVNALGLDELKNTEIYVYGASFTSTPDMNMGIINDKYYYVDKEGKRTAINEQCVSISGGGNGNFTGVSGKTIYFDHIQVTRSNCGENFRSEGKEIYYSQQKEVMDFWMNYFD